MLIIWSFCLGQCLREKNDMELKLLNSSAFPGQHDPTDDQKLIKLLREELRNYVSI
jgi:mitotic spindle assembly checkpoint protein MAD1